MDFLLSLVITIVSYLSIPVFIFLFYKKPLTKSQIFAIVFINGAIVYGIYLTIYLSLNFNGIPNINATAIWSTIAFFVLKSKSEKHQDTSTKSGGFCKYCGAPVLTTDLKCVSCGKRLKLFVIKKLSYSLILTPIFSIFLLFLVFFNIYQFTLTSNMEDKIASQNNEIIELKSQVKSLKSQRSNMNSELIDTLSKYDSLLEVTESMSSKCDFLDQNIALVTPTGKKYHTLDCPYILQADTFYIDLIDNAEYNGYTPCSQCHY